MKPRVAVVGAGVVGRLSAWRLAVHGAQVTLLEKASRAEAGACSAAAAGMLAPLAEAAHAGPRIGAAGLEALGLWQRLVDDLPRRPLFAANGSWIVALPGDADELAEMEERLARVTASGSRALRPTAAVAADKEPALGGVALDALFLESEGYIDTEAALGLILESAEQAGVTLRFGEEVGRVAPHELTTPRGVERFDCIVDARGLGAAEDHRDLRGVRGELLHLHAPELKLTRPVRLLHPRYPLYVVPRPNDAYLIGATQIESASEAPVSVRSALELLNAAHAFHPALRQAGLTRLVARARPAYFDNQPRLRVKSGMIAANGLFRHGWLLAPAVAEAVVGLALGGRASGAAQAFVEEWP
jgi:glycine oxidase